MRVRCLSKCVGCEKTAADSSVMGRGTLDIRIKALLFLRMSDGCEDVWPYHASRTTYAMIIFFEFS